ncbi:MAG TPA: hypothetical protein VIK04_12460 [Solirubrobacteraceae bacterium]
MAVISTVNVRCARTEIPVNPDASPGNAALELSDQLGTLERKSAYVTTCGAPQRSMLEAALARNETAEASLGAIFRRPCDVSVQEARVAGQLVHPQAARSLA